MWSLLALPVTVASLVFGAFPASSHYKLNSYGVGSGGTVNSASSGGLYKIEGTAGETSAAGLTGSHYNLKPGFISTQQAPVPPAATLANDAGTNDWYNKLHITISPSSNPSDATFAVAISGDNWATTNYVQSDGTVGSALGSEDRLTYSSWGGSGGINIIGLSASTTYKVKVKAYNGKYTESAYGPEASAATVSPQLSFDIDISASDTETAAPYQLDIGNLLAGSPTTASSKMWFDFATNATNGGNIYVYSNGALSSSTGGTITSADADLSVVATGYGLRYGSSTATSGTLTVDSAFNATGTNVKAINTTIRTIFSATAPVTGGRTSMYIAAKASSSTRPGSDYTDTITAIASGNF